MVGIDYELKIQVYEPKRTPVQDGLSYLVWPSVWTETCYWSSLTVKFSPSCSKCQSSMSRLNWFPPLIRLNWIESYDLIQLVLFGSSTMIQIN